MRRRDGKLGNMLKWPWPYLNRRINVVQRYKSQNKVAIVTGGSKGIGKAIVKKLLQLKVKVALTYAHDNATAETLEKELDLLQTPFLIIKSDVTKLSDIVPLYQKIEEYWQAPVNYLVNNAGVLKQGDFFAIAESEWDWIINTNLKGPFFLSQEFMKRYNNGNIVNIASIGGQIGGDKAPHYASSKGAIISLTKSLARLGSRKNIRVNAVAPGWIETKIFSQQQLSRLQKEAKQAIPLGRLGKPHEVADAVAFLLSDDASFITGHCLNVNGGMYFG
ncbi:MAG TPA: SDR family oxidoreductase [Gammaproteobacteria bacterium]|nr:SDR family oxidoreductase [Gammaproteobacteria bacterium]